MRVVCASKGSAEHLRHNNMRDVLVRCVAAGGEMYNGGTGRLQHPKTGWRAFVLGSVTLFLGGVLIACGTRPQLNVESSCAAHGSTLDLLDVSTLRNWLLGMNMLQEEGGRTPEGRAGARDGSKGGGEAESGGGRGQAATGGVTANGERG